jgi:hypothetical protein
MRTDGRGPQTSATWMLGRRRRRRTVIFRSLLLSVAVFTLSAFTGALLAGSAPSSPAEVRNHDAGDPATHSADEQVFAQSMVFSGTAALTLSVTGLVIVGRRRRFW